MYFVFAADISLSRESFAAGGTEDDDDDVNTSETVSVPTPNFHAPSLENFPPSRACLADVPQLVWQLATRLSVGPSATFVVDKPSSSNSHLYRIHDRS